MTVATPSRQLWRLVEAVHAVTYFSPAARAAHEEIGLRGFWRGYFAMRAAPMGPVAAPTVVAAFANFHPEFVGRAVPEVWSIATPAETLIARQRGAVAALEASVAEAGVAPEALGELSTWLFDVVAPEPRTGRPLFAANAALPIPADPLGSLWLATTVLREHRGDGHVAALVEAGLSGLESHLLRVAVTGEDPATLMVNRGWSDEEAAGAHTALRARGLVDDAGVATAAGRDLRAQVEETTDRLAEGPVERLGDRGLDEVTELLGPVAAAIADDVVPYPNPVGVDRPGPA